MDSFVLRNENKKSFQCSHVSSAWWPDGSIKWAAIQQCIEDGARELH
ncbi:MAG: hypothetical protein ACLS3U_10065 [Lachnospiraceae bacterium]